MRLVYLGTPEAAVPPLEALVAAGHEVVLVVSRPDTRRGRGGAVSASPVKAAALALGLAVTDDVGSVVSCGAELGVVVAYGRILRPHVLAAVPMLNLHFSLLPRWRGAAPVERAILAGDPRTGVCVMDVDETLDTGAVHARAEIPLDGSVTAPEVRRELSRLGAELLVDTLAVWPSRGVPQAAEGITYAEKLTAADLALDPARPAAELHRVVRVGGAHCTFRGRRLKVPAAEPAAVEGPARAAGTLAAGADGVPELATGDGTVLRLLRVQPEGKAPMAGRDWWNGYRPGPDEVITP